MKKRIICGLCLFFVLTSVFVLVSLNAAAQNDHGGRTQVIARIKPPSDEGSTEPVPESSDPVEGSHSSEDQPVSTGDMTFLLTGTVTAAAVFSLALMIVVWKDESDSADSRSLSGKIKKK